jgi:hypothetical protein
VDTDIGYISRDAFGHMFHRNERVWDFFEDRLDELGAAGAEERRTRGGGGGRQGLMSTALHVILAHSVPVLAVSSSALLATSFST